MVKSAQPVTRDRSNARPTSKKAVEEARVIRDCVRNALVNRPRPGATESLGVLAATDILASLPEKLKVANLTRSHKLQVLTELGRLGFTIDRGSPAGEGTMVDLGLMPKSKQPELKGRATAQSLVIAG